MEKEMEEVKLELQQLPGLERSFEPAQNVAKMLQSMWNKQGKLWWHSLIQSQDWTKTSKEGGRGV